VGRRGAIFGLTAALSAVGGFVGPLVGAFLATGLGFRATFIASGTLLLIVAAMVIWSAEAVRGPDVQTVGREAVS